MTWHWNIVNQELQNLYDQNKDKDKHVRSDDNHTTLYVHGDEAHSIVSDKEKKYANAVRLIKAAIKLDYGDGKDERVFSKIDIKKDTDGLKLKKIVELQKEVSSLTLLDAQRFRYVNLPKLELKKDDRSGSIFKLMDDTGKFYVFRTHDADDISNSNDQSRWDYPGDKVHISIQVPVKDDEAQIADAWNNVILPHALEHHDTIKEFKVSNMKAAGDKLPRADVERIYYGAQISVYLRATPGDEKRVAERFAEVMKSVNYVLKTAGISKPGKQPDSDLKVSDYLSFRHDLDDLLPDGGAKNMKQRIADINNLQEYIGYDVVTIQDSDPRYGAHKKAMEDRLLYKYLKERVK
jgi:Salmonella virulence-associated 28kDa protein